MLSGGDGADVVSYARTSGVTVDLNNTAAAEHLGAGMDTLSAIENINGSTTGADSWRETQRPTRSSAAAETTPSTSTEAGATSSSCGDGTDEVFLDRSDIVRFRFDAALGTTCETVDDGLPPTDTTITAGPARPHQRSDVAVHIGRAVGGIRVHGRRSTGDLGAGRDVEPMPLRRADLAADGRCLGICGARRRRPGQRDPVGFARLHARRDRTEHGGAGSVRDDVRSRP